MTLKILDLFSGLGGFSLGLERTGHFRTIAFCDNDKYCNLVLQKHWKGVKIYNDVKEITKERLEADGIQSPDIITGGFPCQPFSVAGKQKGTSDDRHLWPEMFRIIKEFTPRWVIGENVKGLVNLQDGVVFETVCTDLEGEGYEVRAFNIPAAGVGAPHKRERIWIIASLVNANSNGSSATKIGGSFEKTSNDDQEGQNKTSESKGTSGRERNENLENSRRTLRQGSELEGENANETRKEDANQHQRSSSPSKPNVANTHTRLSNGSIEEVQSGRQTFDTSSERVTDVAYTYGKRLEGFWTKHELREGKKEEQTSGDGWWQSEPNVGRVAHGVQGRVHRLKGLGNSIVPQIVEEIGYAIIKATERK